MKDRFSGHSSEYSRFRPSYPKELIDFLVSQTKSQNLAWDCGTGNGQLAVLLSEHFKEVHATDLSTQQISNAERRSNIIYRTATAEDAEFNLKFDLISVAQAIHWFDLNRFYDNAKRHLNKEGIIAAIGYSLLRVNPEVDKVLDHFYHDLIHSYWDFDRKQVEEHYRNLPFPFREIEAPEFEAVYDWPLERLLGYLNTWSAVKNYIREHNENPVEIIAKDLRKSWGDRETLSVSFPIFARVGKKL